MSIAKGLKQLGFTPEVDFICQNDGDGRGDYIAKWISSSAQPSDSDITAPLIENPKNVELFNILAIYKKSLLIIMFFHL